MPETADPVAPPRQVGRYILFGELAAGGMAAVHFGLLNGPVGFRRAVAIKRLHENYARDPSFVSQFLDEARLAARIRHPNVVQTLDVVTASRELLLVMEYVDGETLADLRRMQNERDALLPIDIAVGVVAGALHGLHAAHQAKDENGVPLNIVHRDVSPQNVIVGRDGVARVLDFGVAKAAARFHSTQGELVKGKLKYMAPEQVTAKDVDCRTDVFAAGIVLWEALTNRTLFEVPDGGAAAVINRVINTPIDPPKKHRSEIPDVLNAVVMKALEREPQDRFQSALDFAEALEEVIRIPTTRKLGKWVVDVAGEVLEQRAEEIANIEKRAIEPDLEGLSDAMISSISGQASGRISVPPPPGPDDQTVVDTPATGVAHVPSSEPSNQKRWRWVAAVGFLSFMFGVLVWAGVTWGPEHPAGGGEVLVAGSKGPHTGASTSVQAASPQASSSDTSAASPEPTPPKPTSAPPAASSSPKPPVVVPLPPPPPPKPPEPDCSTPTYVDQDGIRRYRVECL